MNTEQSFNEQQVAALPLVLNLNQSLEHILEFVEKAPKELKRLENELSIVDLELSDIYHYMEKVKFNASEGCMLAIEIQKVLLKRRNLKLEYSRLKATHQKFSGMFLSRDKTKAIAEEVGKIKQKSYEKEFAPKIRTDLETKIKPLN